MKPDSQTTRFNKAVVLKVLWYPIGLPFFLIGIIAAFALDATKTGFKFFNCCLNDLLDEP
ncbi:MAG: hypothetical protein KGL39_11600 [Patescibacteria group bacterium]|nr:hypothetical protein [Patescibacteria group bacterium]